MKLNVIVSKMHVGLGGFGIFITDVQVRFSYYDLKPLCLIWFIMCTSACHNFVHSKFVQKYIR